MGQYFANDFANNLREACRVAIEYDGKPLSEVLQALALVMADLAEHQVKALEEQAAGNFNI